jgi:bacillithiol synthase
MQLKKLAFADTKSFSPFFLDYIQQKDSLKPFYHRFPEVKNFKDQIVDKSKSFPQSTRDVLVSVLEKQYKLLTPSDAVKKNIASLSGSKTFTVTTGHQLNIFTGPLYFIYKIVTVINTCAKLKAAYPEYTFVPVYWMASEDHDYDEIKYFRLYGKKYVWETQQKGAVGRFNTTGLDQIAKELPGGAQLFADAYQKSKTLGDAVRHYVNSLFGNEGLVVVDADDGALKSTIRNVIVDDVLRCNTLKHVDLTNEALSKSDYKLQVFCRDINFFYLDKDLRSRIEKNGETYQVLETDLKFSAKQIEDLVEKEPEKFSPNVILRPLYQETILPNLAYVGGPAEVVYWLQLKNIFDYYKIPFPILMPRNFALVIDQPTLRKFEKTGLDLPMLFEEKNYIFNSWILKNSNHNLTVGTERTTAQKIFEDLRKRAESIDKTLAPFVGAEGKRILNSLEKIERKMLRAEKRQQSDKLRQIEAVKDTLFPGGSLQERTDNFLNFYQQDNQFLSRLIQLFDPFDFKFNVLLYSA